ncbi:hypothetical protein ACIQCR_35090 [Streptomyces sp. NPDC093249]|uniref:hypothetical protein n=1 Tax=unclassified Streptomyces TaxID=2593676 RepID=UPI003825A6D5
MSQIRRNTTAPSRPWVERTDRIAESLRTIKLNHAIAFLARALYNASDQLIAEKLHVSPDEAAAFCSIGYSTIRHPSRSHELWDVLDDTDAGALVIDRGLRDLIRSWCLEEMFAPLCGQCEHRMETVGPVYGSAGRPRRYCSNACRQKAYRARQRARPSP